jgi:hypothetical protein
LAARLFYITTIIGNIPGRLESTWLYPNGGTAASPANVSNNSRYVMSNPYPGYMVKLIAHIKYNNKWCETGAYTGDSSGYGIVVQQLLPDDTIILVSRSSGVLNTKAGESGAGFGLTSFTAVTSAPCRIYVEKGDALP